jgi:SAM-dependent methyltransferase
MLAVAKRKAPEIEWRQGNVEALPFDSNSFDAVVCQFGLMFFENRLAAIKEMVRVLRQGGQLAIAVWDSLENTPGYASITKLLERLFGDKAADAMRAPFVLGDIQVLQSLFTDAGISSVQIKTHDGTARFPSISSWVYTDVRGWTLADMIDDAQYQLLLQEAENELQQFITSEGTVVFRSPAHIITATKA